MGILNVVGIGPGNNMHMTPAVLKAIQEAEHIIGYTTYLRLIKDYIQGKEITRTGMSEEIGRAKAAIELAKEGKIVTLVSSGDAGVYGMLGLVFECLKEINWKRGDDPQLNIIPGISATNSCSSLVGAPLVHDACTISLSDLLTPWSVIEKRIESAAEGDFVIAFYNPASGRRQRQIVEAQKIIKRFRSGDTPVALVKSAYRNRQNIVMSDLDNFLDYEIGMLTTVIVGSSQTYMYEGYMVTPRGHRNKYDIKSGSIKDGQRKTFSLRHDGDLKSRDEGKENLLKAKTYATPSESWVTPKDKHNKDFLKNEFKDDVSSAQEALNILNEIQNKKELLKKQEKVEREFEKTQGSFTEISNYYGALLFEDGESDYLIGECKEPNNSFKVIESYDNGKIRKVEVLEKKKEKKYLWKGSGVESARDIYNKFIIYRNHSVSRRLKEVVESSGMNIEFKGNQLIDARWLATMPLNVWEIIREEKLKC